MTLRDKRKKFKELAEKPVTRALKDIKLIGNLSNRNYYEYDRGEGQKIIAALEKEVRALKARFEESGDDEVSFRL